MAKFKPGIPDTFALNVTPVQDLGDYLDEPPPTPRPKARVVEPAAPVHEPARTQPVVAEQVAVAAREPAAPAVAPIVERHAAPAAEVVTEPVRNTAVTPEPPPAQPVAAPPPVTENVVARNDDERDERAGRPKAPRREISMTPETLRMSDELLDIIRSGSGQRDTKANELFHALVLLVHEVRDEIDTHSIPKRGRWGTPTARAYPVELKNAFLKALLKKAAAQDLIELRYEVGSAA